MKILPVAACAASMWLIVAPAASQVPGTASDDVPEAVAERVRRAAEGSDALRLKLADLRTVFVTVDLIRRKGEGGRELAPIYRVQHYRYADDTTIVSLVDLDSGRVREVEELRHAPVALGAAELAEARALALADERVSRATSRFREQLVVEPLVVRTSDPADPWFGRRVVRLLFRVGRDYLSEPVVFVDLTNREVIIERAHGNRQ